MLEPLDDRMKELTIRDYVCSNCWGDLIPQFADNRLWLVVCNSCREETKGYVTRYYAENRRSESHGEHSETRLLLQSMGIIPNEHSGKSEEELLRELGF
jgi:hypothetical protein